MRGSDDSFFAENPRALWNVYGCNKTFSLPWNILQLVLVVFCAAYMVLFITRLDVKCSMLSRFKNRVIFTRCCSKGGVGQSWATLHIHMRVAYVFQSEEEIHAQYKRPGAKTPPQFKIESPPQHTVSTRNRDLISTSSDSPIVNDLL